MSLLLDTSVFVFLSQEPRRIPRAVRARVESNETPLFVSAASWYEIDWKITQGRLSAQVGVDLDRAVDALVATRLDITPAHTARAGQLPKEHRDPWDRVIAAQALLLGFPVVSPDDKFDILGAPRLWA